MCAYGKEGCCTRRICLYKISETRIRVRHFLIGKGAKPLSRERRGRKGSPEGVRRAARKVLNMWITHVQEGCLGNALRAASDLCLKWGPPVRLAQV